jgi:putative tryptophan/tyrosine transport system substrate-binding protein
MKRRQFIAFLGSAAAGAAFPRAPRAQQAMPVIGYLGSGSVETGHHLAAAFRQGLGEAGFSDGRNVVIEYRWQEGQYSRAQSSLADLLSRRPAVIAVGGIVAAQAAKAATSTVPVLFTTAPDPVAMGLVASINRPGGNMTGVSMGASELTAKRFGLLHELLPGIRTFAFLVNPDHPNAQIDIESANGAAAALGRNLRVLQARADHELEQSFAAMADGQADALCVGADAYFLSRRKTLTALAARYRIPTVYEWRDFIVEGGLMSYGTRQLEVFRQLGVYAGRILKGERPADLPVLFPTVFDLGINLKTAKALGIEVPATLLARADEVIE